ncbi:MAG TPA: hypothetical protein VGN82_09645 [Bosea sp. (in: a-proteobacteria)]|jgi:hypothetical protein|uniref:hypothetical protein n=1 Tax=Bosea sp. (in: a-proteobacteria) TaxID=1871050 RepID=UPI002E1509A5|nr:hypothetical protein [Bosea sp. (in: a-proteobacteria)]
MRHGIETAPKDGHFVILEDDANASYDVGRWSVEAGGWVGKDDEPVKITPTHWHPFARDAYLQPDDEEAVVADPIGRPARSRSLAAVVVAITAATALFYYLSQEAAHPPARSFGDGKVAQEARPASPDSKNVPEVRQTIEREPSPPTGQEQAARQQQAAVLPVPDAQQSPTRPPTQVSAQDMAMTQELGEARRTIERLEAQLRADVAAEQQALKQERERSAVLAEQATAARQELATSAQQHARALDEERTRNAAVTKELATARLDIETQTERLRRANSEIALSKQAEATKTGQMLEQHRQNVAALAEAVAARQELTTTTAQHIQTLEQERARNASLAGELALARREIETHAAQLRQASDEAARPGPAQLANAERSLEQQRESTAAALAEAAAARQELKAGTAQHDQALDDERARSAALESELATVRRKIEAQAAQEQEASTETALLKQAVSAKSEQLLEQQRQKEAALADAATARQDLTTSTAEHRRALDEEKARNAALANELATAQQVNEKLATQFRLVGEQTELRRRTDEAKMAALQQSAKDERDRAVAFATELDTARRAAAARLQPETATGSIVSRETVTAGDIAAASSAASDQQGGAEAARMIARAGMLLGQGDIGAARIVLERATELGSARAVFMLAETYDPRVLSAWKTYGTRGEVTRARELYAKAHEGGIREAKERLDALAR